MNTNFDPGAIAICNHCECEKKPSCKRYNRAILASYDFAQICHGEWMIPNGKDTLQQN